MISSALFRVIEHYEGVLPPGPAVYESLPMCLGDASRFAAALSYARGVFVHVLANDGGSSYQEWWLAGALVSQGDLMAGRSEASDVVCWTSLQAAFAPKPSVAATAADQTSIRPDKGNQ